MLSLNLSSVKKAVSKHIYENDKHIYHLAVIDYLQEWNLSKKCERFFKTIVLRKSPTMLSAIEPNEYARRFLHFVEMNVFN
jgi:hypothetical protein